MPSMLVTCETSQVEMLPLKAEWTPEEPNMYSMVSTLETVQLPRSWLKR